MPNCRNRSTPVSGKSVPATATMPGLVKKDAAAQA